MILNIRNMVCRHCVQAVERLLSDIGIKPVSVELGRAVIDEQELTPAQLSALDKALTDEGFERILTPEAELTERAKHVILNHLRREECPLNLSACLERHLGTDYPSISRAFSATEGRTIEKYHIAQKVELVKELLLYGGLTLAEIADRAGYSSAAHLSRQFKSVTGMTTTQYLSSRPERSPLNMV